MEPVSTADLPSNGQPKSIMLSSNATLMWRIFVPIFGTVFVSGLLVAFWVTDQNEGSRSVLSVMGLRIVVTALWFGWVFFVRRTLWRLKRVDADPTHFYVTNYWTTARYPWQDLERIEEKKRLGRRLVNFHLRAPGRFGSIVSFLPGTLFEGWRKEQVF